MNARPAGWERDPSGRHEYRYWDGASWSDDVADQGVTSVDPMGADDPTAVVDPTRPYAAVPGGVPGDAAGPPQDGYDQPTYGGGPHPGGPPPTSGPSLGLVVGLAAAAIAVIVGLVVVLTAGDDDGDDDISTVDVTEDTATDDTSGDTSTDDTSGDTSTDDTSGGDTGDTSGGESSDDVVSALADTLVATGQFDQEQADCLAQTMLDDLGRERLAELGATGDFSSLTSEDLSTVFDALSECGITEMPTGFQTES
jgi:Protein of unknown function (DUF2510)